MLYPQIGDKVDIVCPRSDASPGTKEEFHRVYMVSRSQMESCTVDKADMLLLNCNKPHQDVKYTLKFQEFSPNLWGLEFLRGKDYYITCESQPLTLPPPIKSHDLLVQALPPLPLLLPTVGASV